MPNLIVDFPNEILIQVFETLSNRDIDGLHKVPEFRHRLQSLIVVVCEDTAKSNFRYIKNNVSFADWTPDRDWSGFYRVIVDINSQSETAVKRLCETTDFAQGHVSVFGHYFREEMQTLFEEPIGTHAKTIAMEELKYFTCRDCAVIPELIDFPGVENCSMERCPMSQFSKGGKFNMPLLQSINITQCDSLHTAVDYEGASDLRTMRLVPSTTEADESFEEITCHSMETLSIGGRNTEGGMFSIQGVWFENLKTLNLYSRWFSYFCDVNLPSATSIKIECPREFDDNNLLRMVNVYAPSLVELNIERGYISELHDCDFGPNLQDVTLFCTVFEGPNFEGEEVIVEIDYSCFADVVYFKTDDCVEALLHMPYLSSLELRHWNSRDDNVRIVLPHLRSLVLSAQDPGITSLPFTAPALVHMKITSRNTPPDLSWLEADAPSLKSLTITTAKHSDVKFSHPTLEDLKIFKNRLSYMPYNALNFECSLNALKCLELDLDYNADTVDPGESYFSLKAPQLNELTLSGLKLSECDLSPFPCLERAHIRHGVKSLKFGSSAESLKVLALYANPDFENIEPVTFPQLVHLSAGGTPYMAGAEIQTPLLKKTVHNYVAKFELLHPEDYYLDEDKDYYVLKQQEGQEWGEYEEQYWDQDDRIAVPVGNLMDYLNGLNPNSLVSVADLREILYSLGGGYVEAGATDNNEH